MSTGKKFSDGGRRLREEREKLGLSQAELGTVMGGAGEKTVRNWESGTSAPDAAQLGELADKGGDVLYIVTGRRAPLMTGEPISAIHQTPIQKALNRISMLTISEADAELLVVVAKRFSKPAG